MLSAKTNINRRRLLQIGGIGAIGLGLPELLSAKSSRRSEMSCIFIVQYGGCSHLDTFDPKPDASSEQRGPYKPIATSVPGMQVSEMLPRLAKQASRFSLIRSMTHGTADHNGGMHVCMTGRSKPKESNPYFGSVMAKLRPATQKIPSYVWLQDLDRDVRPWYLTGGVLGAAYSPMLIGKRQENYAKPDFRVRAFDPPPGVTTEQLRQRFDLLRQIESPQQPLLKTRAAADFQSIQEQALELATGTRARAAYDINREGTEVRDRYGRNPFGQNLLMARRLIENGVRLVSVNAWCGVAPGHKFLVTQGWDHHGAAVQKCGIFSNGSFGLGFVLPRFDQAVAALIDDLHQRGLLESTLVVAVGEFGRSPKISTKPYAGRDHWPRCYSALLAGGGIRGGAVWGSSNRDGGYVKGRAVSPEDFGATLFHALGVPPQTLIAPDRNSDRASEGKPIADLFG